MTKTAEFSHVKKFYESLAQKMRDEGCRFLLVPVPQEPYDLKETIFIPFDDNDLDGKSGYGLYLFFDQIHNGEQIAYTLIAVTSLQLVKPQYKRELARLLHEINLCLPIPGWILNDKENTLHFKFVFSGINLTEEIPLTYLTLLVEIVNGIVRSFPLFKEINQGRSFTDIRDLVATKVRPTQS